MQRLVVLITPRLLDERVFSIFAANRDGPTLRLSPAVDAGHAHNDVDAVKVLALARRGELDGAVLVSPFSSLPVSLKTHAEVVYRGQRCLVSGIEYLLAARYGAEVRFVPDLALHDATSSHVSNTTPLPANDGWTEYCSALLDAAFANAAGENLLSWISVDHHRRFQLSTIRRLRVLLSCLDNAQSAVAMEGLARLRPAIAGSA